MAITLDRETENSLENQESSFETKFSPVKISQREYIQRATKNPKAVEAARWLHETSTAILQGDRYPSRDEMIYFGVDEQNYLRLTGAFYSIPGGGGSQKAPGIMQQRHNSSERRTTHEVWGIHISDTPRGSDLIHLIEEQNVLLTGGGSRIQSGVATHLSYQHAETTCGMSGGVSEKIVSLLENNLRQREVGKNPKVKLERLEARVGQATGEEIWQPDAFRVHDANDIHYTMNNETGLNQQQFNDKLRGWMEEGDLIYGITCFDRRMFASTPKVDLESVREVLSDQIPGWRKAINGPLPYTSYQAEGHSESPIAILNTGNDQKITALAWQALQDGNILLKNNTYLAEAQPAIINLPFELLGDKDFVEPLLQLLINLDKQVYGGYIGKFMPRSRFFVESGNEKLEVTGATGLQIVYSKDISETMNDVKVARYAPSIFRKNTPYDPNPKVHAMPFFARAIGMAVE